MNSNEFNLLISIYDYLTAEIQLEQLKYEDIDSYEKAAKELYRARAELLKAGDKILNIKPAERKFQIKW